jgi:hypothetical protein
VLPPIKEQPQDTDTFDQVEDAGDWQYSVS